MAHVRLFLSTVSAEFRSYRERLRHLLDRPNVTVKVQEDFIVTGDETLEMLDTYIRECDGVIHLVGDMTGAMAKPPSVVAMREQYPELAERLPLAEFLQPEGPSLSYTQWEAWLALLHGKPLFIATPTPEAPRDPDYRLDPAQQGLQQAHLARLKEVARYAGVRFSGKEHLAAEVLRSFVLDLLVEAGLTRRPTTLPYAPLGELLKGRDDDLQKLQQQLGPIPENAATPKQSGGADRHGRCGQDAAGDRACLAQRRPPQRRALCPGQHPGGAEPHPGGLWPPCSTCRRRTPPRRRSSVRP